MKVILLVIISASLISLQQKQEKEYTVKGEIHFIGVHCGGAAPSEEMQRRIRIPRPLAHKKLFIRQGSTNDISAPILDSVITDSLGIFTCTLPNGTYSVVEEAKKDRKLYRSLLKGYSKPTPYHTAVDKECLDKWLAAPDFTFIVNGEDGEIQHSYRGRCSWDSTPCSSYRGPLPPSAR